MISPGDSSHISHRQSVIVKLTAIVTVVLLALAPWVVRQNLTLTLFVVVVPKEPRQVTIGDDLTIESILNLKYVKEAIFSVRL